ncbi:helix-turn-helix transcriptional regulator [Janthinobacterium sp. 64]|uniref:helix-turn-helix transcriptional regulator n=1 Tax=Janthinobacterium sp. 64 TaxID=2035208 RepID=UPI000C2B94E3|nr:WYL domain-containing protein [Janthinobacterium sp. 64]PKB20097.1 putative DNA-binding transcriptional regulator YafY [Janthinobacterium sp. 64]
MATNQQSLLRQWHMLQDIPRAPSKVSVENICVRLKALGYVVTARTVQRDLQALRDVFALEVDAREKPFGWSWRRDAPPFSIPGVTIPEALTLKLVEQHLHHQLPPHTAQALRPHFAAAERTLATLDSSEPSNAWLDKIRHIPSMLPLLPPVQDEAVRNSVYEALMQDCQLGLSYRRRDAAAATDYPVVHPLAIAQRAGVVYLICMFADYTDIRMLALHRIEHAQRRYEPARKCPDFNLDAYIAAGHLGIVSGAPLALRATFSSAAGAHLYETRLHAEQTLERAADGSLTLCATVPNTQALRWWLLGFGAGVSVLEPAALRSEMAAIAQQMAASYA